MPMGHERSGLHLFFLGASPPSRARKARHHALNASRVGRTHADRAASRTAPPHLSSPRQSGPHRPSRGCARTARQHPAPSCRPSALTPESHYSHEPGGRWLSKGGATLMHLIETGLTGYKVGTPRTVKGDAQPRRLLPPPARGIPLRGTRFGALQRCGCLRVALSCARFGPRIAPRSRARVTPPRQLS